MKKYLSFFLCALTIMLSACSKQPELKGTYSTNFYGTGLSYTFSEGLVTADYTMIGFDVMHYEGQYTFDDDRKHITLMFDSTQWSSNSLPTGMTSLGGTFEFEQGEDYIMIGSVKYTQNMVKGTQSKSANTPETGISATKSSDGKPESNAPITETDILTENLVDDTVPEPDIVLSDLHLNLPEEYEIAYQITESAGLSRTYTHSMTKTNQGYYFNFADSGEQLIFEKLDSGKYIQYMYDTAQGRFFAPALSESVQMQIDNGVMTKDMVAVDYNVVNGYASRLTVCFNFYENYRGNMTYQGEENIGNWKCQKYTAVTDSISGTHAVDLWIAPELGLCVKAAYEYNAPIGGTATKVMECISFSTDNISLPDYQ